MKKNINIIFILFLFAVCIANIFLLYSNFLLFAGNIFYTVGDKQRAYELHKKSRQQDETKMNAFYLGRDYYVQEEYAKARELFETSLGEKEKFAPLFNIGNVYFYEGEEQQHLEKRAGLWEKSIEYFDRALALDPENIEAQNNRFFVYKKLKELQERQQEQSSQEQTEKSQTENTSESGGESELEEKTKEKTDSQNTEDEPVIQEQRGDQYQLDENSQGTELSDKERADVEKYIDFLEKEQQENQRYYGKEDQGDFGNLNDIIDNFFQHTPFGRFDFDTDIDRGGEKDW